MDYYVYFLQDPRTSKCVRCGFELNYEPFYIGKGKGQRCFTSRGRSKWVINKINKLKSLGLQPHITKIGGYTEQEAFEVEKDFIQMFGRKVMNEGPLLNLNEGGKGSWGFINNCLPNGMLGKHHSEETKQKIREKRLGIPSPMKGKKQPKTSLALQGHIVTQETREKLRQHNLGKKHSCV